MIELIKFSGCTLSLVLVFTALHIRFSKHLDTTKLAADWSLLLIAGAGSCMFFYFYKLDIGVHLKLRASLIATASMLYIAALVLWFYYSIKGVKRD